MARLCEGVWAHYEVGLAEWIMRERLAGAAPDLRDAARNAAPIAAIARARGFSIGALQPPIPARLLHITTVLAARRTNQRHQE